MKSQQSYTTVTTMGALVGAVVGASVAYLLVKNPPAHQLGKDPGKIQTKQLLGIINTSTSLFRQINGMRHKL